jgi:hypothetical protein
VFDLWLGTIESHDGALQLIHIVDFIWTWARDIYRPWIRRCLRGDENRGAFSPTSSDAFSRAGSILSNPSLPFAHSDNIDAQSAIIVNDMDYAYGGTNSAIEDGQSHPIFDLIVSQDNSAGWASQTRTRHSDVVFFSFQILELPHEKSSLEDLFKTIKDKIHQRMTHSDILKIIRQSQNSIPLTRANLLTIHREWTGSDASLPSVGWSDLDEIVMAFFSFRTWIRPESWQITREICCMIWPAETVKILNELTSMSTSPIGQNGLFPTRIDRVMHEMLRVRNLFGNVSVELAFEETTLVLSQNKDQITSGEQLQWTTLTTQRIDSRAIGRYQKLFEATSSRNSPMADFRIQSGKLLWVRRELVNEEDMDDLTHVSRRSVDSGALFALRPDDWPPEIARFCLFIVEDGPFDGPRLQSMLSRASVNEVFGGSERAVASLGSPNSKHILRSWKAVLGSFG